MKLKHTPGPWKVGKTITDKTPLIMDKKGIGIASPVLWPEWKANARLIAAAPEMLDNIIEHMTTFEVLKEIFEKNNPTIWGVIRGAYLQTPIKSEKIIEKATDLSIKEVLSE